MAPGNLIEKFYSNDCSPEEREEIILYFKENLEELNNYFSEEEWNHFITEDQLAPEISKRIYKGVRQQTREKTKVINLFKKLAVAASVLLILGIGWLYFSKEVSQPLLADKNVSLKIADTLNTGDSVMILKLPDNTLVELEPGSELKYPLSFEDNKREVVLKGKAMFNVARDTTKPFTVFSSEIATTVLGTRFLVTAPGKSDSIKVRLFEGKVVIRLVDSLSSTLAEDYYLLPGEEFKLDRKSMTAGVVQFNKSSPGIKKAVSPAPTLKTNNWYMFNNQNLPEVLDQLAIIYQVKILYKKEDLNGMNFIGRIGKNDSIVTILKDISELNKLNISQKGNTYTLEKIKH